MTLDEITYEVVSIFRKEIDSESAIGPTTALRDTGIGSIDVPHLILCLEDRWPRAEEALDDLNFDDTFEDIARKIEPHV